MNKTFSYVCALLSLACMCISTEAAAKKAELVLFPTRVVMEGNNRTATLTIKNSGDATGQFTVDTLDMVMPEDGAVREAAPEDRIEFSALEMVHVSPRSMTLAPGESQNIRVMARTPDSVGDGEYRAHLRVKMVNDNADPETSDKGPSVHVRANLALVIPVIIRKGETAFQAKLSGARIVHSSGSYAVQLYIHRDGNRSSMGDLKIIQQIEGKEVLLGELNGIPVYRPTEKRKVIVPLDKKPSGGKVRVIYKEQKDKDGASSETKTLAEAAVEAAN